MFWMQFPNTWYGPFASGDAIMCDVAGTFYVWDADAPNMYGGVGNILWYATYNTAPRNVWFPLNQSHFRLMIDNFGNVYGVHQ